MANTYEFKLPDVGEGLVEAEIVSWKVRPGDEVGVNAILVEIETAKSLVELPSPYAGKVGRLLAEEGEVVEVGRPIISLLVGDGAAVEPEAAEETPATLVGYGPRASSTGRRPRRSVAEQIGVESNGSGPVAQGAAEQVTEPVTEPVTESVTEPAARSAASRVLAKPPVRKLAKDLGIDLTRVPPTGSDGIVTRADVEAYAAIEPTVPAGTAPTVSAEAGPRETRVPIRGVRKATAEAVGRSAREVPHVTEWLTVDVTATVELVERLRTRPELAEVKVSPLLIVAKACLLALGRTPELNATWDESAGEIVLKHYVNLGIAAATPRGLLVPHVKDADRLALPALAKALNELTRTAREGGTQPGDMIGTTFTITNVGVFGVEAGTPILNPGETGILAVGAIQRRPWVVVDRSEFGTEETIVPRWVATLALSFDHRVVDGEQGSRFLTDVGRTLNDPALGWLLT